MIRRKFLTFGTANDIAPTRRELPIIDAKAETIEETVVRSKPRPHPLSRTCSARYALCSIVASAALGSGRANSGLMRGRKIRP